MRTLASVTAITFAASLSACASMQTPEMAPLPDAAAEAAFRFIFANNSSGLQGQASNYCIGIGQGTDLRDPSPAVIQSLADVRKVVPASACEVSTGVTNRAGQPSLVFSVEAVDCIDSVCVVRAGYYEGNVSSQTSQYTLRQANGRWMVDPSATVQGPVS